ncbi:tolloid-like protein 2 [Dendronephthya gigantea]|uniref:tolloid-like protein 2 n=1 Tax=Dendronephthya gigantea TaxID=151771 RepID=UPI001069BBD8|nr:tolloid-like protein 2 [Dendronephthya gigantea]
MWAFEIFPTAPGADTARGITDYECPVPTTSGCVRPATLAIDHTTDSCGQSFLCSPGTLKSPDYPSRYPNSMSCTWTIFSTIGQKVLLQFSLFKLESHPSCAWDYLDVYDGDSKHAPRLGRFCGDNFPKRLVSSGSKLHLVFYADNNMREEGFILNFTSIYYGKI